MAIGKVISSVAGNGKKITAAGLGLGAVDGATEFYFRRQENPDEHVMKSVGYAGATMAAWYIAPHLMWAKTGAEMGSSITQGLEMGRKAYKSAVRGRSQANFGGYFQDTDMGYTMRQRGVNAIQQSRMNARNAIGGEAKVLHRF